MKKFLFGIAIVAVLAVALGSVSYVYAQSSTPQAPANGTGYGMMGRGARGGGMMGQAGTGLIHDEMVAAYAAKLGLSVDELNTRLANGETMAQIASSRGLTVEEFRTLMSDARAQAIDQAVKNGSITQEQADWMKQRGAGMMGGGRGRGQGRGQGQYANPDCPYYTPAQ